MAAGPGDVLRRERVADARLRRGYHWRRQWLMTIVQRRYKLQREDCEDIANDTLLAWHPELLTAEGVVDDRALCEAVVRTKAIDRLRRKTVQTVELSHAEGLGLDPELGVQVGEREEAGDLAEVAAAVLEAREYEISALVANDVRRGTVAEQFVLTLRQVRRLLGCAQQKLDAGRALLREHGRSLPAGTACLRGPSARPSEWSGRNGVRVRSWSKRYPRKRYDVLACERWLGDSERKRLIAAERIAALEAQVASLAVQVEELRRTA
jgi:DNA-directed RNA polymerase specialized sigma24 family protein